MLEGAILIEGEIVSTIDANTVYPVTTLGFVRDQLRYVNLADLGPDGLRVIINSPGGSTTEAYGIIDELLALGVKICTEAIGQCASAASAIFAIGGTRRMHKNAVLHPHCPFGGISGGTAAQIQQYADDLLACQNQLVQTYAAAGVLGGDAEAILALLNEDRDLTSAEALTMGFATVVLEPIRAIAYAPKAPARSAPTALNSPISSPAPATAPQPQTMATEATNAAGAKQPNRSFIVAAQRILGDLGRLLKGEPIKALSIKTTGETPLELEIGTGESGEIAAGDPVTVGGAPAPDGEHTLEGGAKIVVKDGLVESYTAAPVDETTTEETSASTTSSEPDGDGATVDEIRATLQRERTEASEFRTSITKRLETVAAMVQTGGVAPTVDPITNSTAESATSAKPGAVKDANSTEAKQAARDRIKARKSGTATK